MDNEKPTDLLSMHDRLLLPDGVIAGIVGRLYDQPAPAQSLPAANRRGAVDIAGEPAQGRESVVRRVCDRATPPGPTPVALDERWDSLLECTPDLVVIVDGEGRILHTSRQRAATALSVEYIGRSIYDFLLPEHHLRVRDAIAEVVQTGRAVRQVVRLAASGGAASWNEASMGPITQDGQTVAVGIFFTDVTDRERLQARLEESEMLLRSIVRAAPKMMDILEGLVQHGANIAESERREQELKLYREHLIQIGRLVSVGKASSNLTQRLPQFLTAIGMSIENALAGLETASGLESVREDLEAALGVVGALAGGVKQVRGFAETGTRRALVHPVDLRGILVRVVRLLEARARQAHTIICTDHLGELPRVRMAEGDAEQLCFSLIEKMICSADGRRHHRTTIRSLVSSHSVELQFSGARGPVGKKHQNDAEDCVFTTEPAVSAADLGLQVAWDVVARTGGRIWSEQAAGGLLTFLVILPIAGQRDVPVG